MTTTKTTSASTGITSIATASTGENALRGAVGGLAGGVAFGMLMQMMGMMSMVAMLVGSDSVAVGWLVHLSISAFIGVTFGLVLGGRVTDAKTGVMLGVGYGIVWWVLGALIAMPAKLGMPVFAINATAMKSLMGHMIFGAILGAVFAKTAHR